MAQGGKQEQKFFFHTWGPNCTPLGSTMKAKKNSYTPWKLTAGYPKMMVWKKLTPFKYDNFWYLTVSMLDFWGVPIFVPLPFWDLQGYLRNTFTLMAFWGVLSTSNSGGVFLSAWNFRGSPGFFWSMPTWNPKATTSLKMDGCLVISNHFLCKDWVKIIQLKQPFINGWPWGFQVIFNSHFWWDYIWDCYPVGSLENPDPPPPPNTPDFHQFHSPTNFLQNTL